MITSVRVGFNRKDQEDFDRLARETPKLMRNAVGRAFSILRRNIIKVMTGEASTFIPALAPWHPLTNRLTRVRKFGGVLSDPNLIRVFKHENVVQVGWLPKLAGTARSWQEPETHTMGNAERHRLHEILGILKEKKPHSIIPMVYQRPKRDVINTLAEATADKMVEWIAGAYEKQIGGALKKGWVTA